MKFKFAIHTSGSTSGVLRFVARVCLGWKLELYNLEGQDKGCVGGQWLERIH